jgi:hypothetical protein
MSRKTRERKRKFPFSLTSSLFPFSLLSLSLSIPSCYFFLSLNSPLNLFLPLFDDKRYESLIAKKPYVQSQYLKNKEEKDRKKVEEALQKATLGENGTGGEGKGGEGKGEGEAEKEEGKGKEKDVFEGQRIHCWVLLLPGKREVT